MSDDNDRTASLMTPARLAQLRARPAPAASPAAWLDQLASDAGSGHVRRLLDLHRQLAAPLQETDAAPLRRAVSGLLAAVEGLDFALLQPRGWLARATGKGKAAAATFGGQVARAERASEDLAEALRDLQRRQQAQGALVERTALEFDVEVRAIEKIMDQGARWLQDMRNQLKARETAADAAAERQKIEEDTRRCELLVARLKQLRVAAVAAQDVVAQCRAAVARRLALLRQLHELAAAQGPSCEREWAALVQEGAAGGCARDRVDAARQAQRAFAGKLRQADADGAALLAQEQGLAQALAAAQQALQAAA